VAKRTRRETSGRPATLPTKASSQAMKVAHRGIQDLQSIAAFSIGTAIDAMSQATDPRTANAASAAIGKSLKAIELHYRYEVQKPKTIAGRRVQLV
jgi:hypothetical protein